MAVFHEGNRIVTDRKYMDITNWIIRVNDTSIHIRSFNVDKPISQDFLARINELVDDIAISQVPVMIKVVRYFWNLTASITPDYC